MRLLFDHAAHVADAPGALGFAVGMAENIGRTRGALVDGGAHVALADAVAVTNVQEDASRRSWTTSFYRPANAVATHLQLLRRRVVKQAGAA